MDDKKRTESGQKHEGKSTVYKVDKVFWGILIMLLLFQLSIIWHFGVTDQKQNQDGASETEAVLARVIGKDKMSEPLVENNAGETEMRDFFVTETEDLEQSMDAFIPMIFDAKESSVGKGQIKVTGLSSGAKEQLSFLEAEFVAELTAFLQKQDIKTSEVVFEKEILTSEENVSGYLLDISGQEKVQLIAFFFPKLPGQYLFTVLEKTVQETMETEIQIQTSQMEVPVSVQTEVVADTDIYDASTLTINSIPEKLLNYLDNRYELQYSLYDYLYKNGYRDVKAVTVEDYEIKVEEKAAEIIFGMPDGGTITGKYNKEKNRYTFYE